MRGAVLCLLVAACAQDVVPRVTEDARVGGRADAVPSDSALDPEPRDADTRSDARADAEPGPDALPGSDRGADDAGRADATAPDASTALACHVDRFSSCADPDEAARQNNSPSDSFYQNGFTVGCASSDNFVAGTLNISSRICHTEPADWFEVTFVPCDSLTMLVRVRLETITACESDAFELQVASRRCGSAGVRCTDNGAVKIVEFAIPPGNSVGFFDFGVVRVAEDVAADYRLTYELYR